MSRIFTIYDGDDEHRYQMADLPLCIGSAKSCPIRLPEGEDIAAKIDVHEGKYLFLKPASEDGKIFHNDQIVTDSSWIKSGDQTRIGDWVILYRISGDRVEIIKKRYTVPEPVNGLAAQEKQSAIPESSSLPPITGTASTQQKRLTRNIAAGLVFLLLIAAALFVLTAHTLEIQIEPQPDNLSLQGKLPLIHIGSRFLGVSGSYTLHAAKEGFKDLDTQVVVSADKPSSYSFTLDKLPGLLSVNSSLQGVGIIIDGKSIGKTPLIDFQLSGGSHNLICRAKKYKDYTKPVEISSGASLSVDCLMESSLGRVFVVSDPAGALVLQGKSELGKTPLTVELEAGEQTLILQEDGYAPASIAVEVKSGETLTPPVVTLQHKKSTFTIRSSPKGAEVQSGGKRLGKTPLQVEWQTGSKHKLVLSLKGYESVNTTVTLNKQSKREVLVTMQPILASVKIEVSPASATLYIDGKKQKKNSGSFRLSTRSHKIEARATGYKSEQQRITPSTEKTKKLFFDLDKTADKVAATTPVTQTQPPPSNQEINKPVMVSLGPGTFTMGASRREPGRRANEGRHEVQLTRPFLLGIHEVTNGEFHRFQPGHMAGNIGGQSLDTDNLPVVKVSWQDAARYCNWLSRHEGLPLFYKEQGGRLVPAQPANNGYRLPFEAEWEFAARKVARTQPGNYPWDGKFPPKPHHGNYADESARTLIPVVIKGYYDGFPVLAPVENFPRNMAGLFDMGGNVSEWCHDYYTPVTAPVSGRAVDPVGPKTGKHHVYRGSSWRDGAVTELRISYRGYASKAKDSLGFRVARYK